MRDYNAEVKDQADHKYAYGFDYIMHQFMMRTFLLFEPEGNVLEMGSYHGAFTKVITDHFFDVTVIEASDECIAIAKKNLPSSVKFIHATFEEARLSTTFENIFLLHTLEHLDSPTELLKKAKSWLSDKGKFFIVCPNANAPSRQIAVKMGLIPFNTAITPAEKEHGHRNTFTLDTLEQQAREAGLRIHHRGGIFFKGLANFQLDKAIETGIISKEYLEGCYQLGMVYPDLCSSIYLICGK